MSRLTNDEIRNRAISIIRNLTAEENGLTHGDLGILSSFLLIERTDKDKLTHYKDLEEQGRLKELPCAVGDTVWLIGKNYNKCTNHYDCEHYDYDEYLITWCEKNCPNGFRGMGVIQAIVETIEINREQVLVQLNAHDNYFRIPITSVFLTKEEAEAKLKKLENE